MRSAKDISLALDKYTAIRTSIRMSDYGYWIVTFSCAPALDLSVLVCQTGISREEAVNYAAISLNVTTGQEVGNK